MISVSSVDIVLGLIKKIRQYKKGYYTNFFLDIPKIELWVSLQLIEYEEVEETVFLLRKNSGFDNLFFITTDISILSRDIGLLHKMYSESTFIVDLVGNYNQISGIKDLLEKRGFYIYTTLVRMSKVTQNDDNYRYDPKYISYADGQRGSEVYKMLVEFFDPFAEQIPLPEEIIKWSDSNSILVFSDDHSTIQGFLIFELTGQTSYLRYWFVHPDHREKKIGSELIRSFFYESRNSKRKLFWVIESNENAIKRYEHWGFKKEELFDFVMINKNIKYE
jgi:ribosomal protein S18 acetylase RimI-like enzyme